MERKEHLTEDGLRKIVAIKGSMNLGLSDSLKAARILLQILSLCQDLKLRLKKLMILID